MTLASVQPPRPLVDRVAPRQVRLTWREIDVLRELLNDGPDNKILGKRLYLAEDTIKTHIRKILSKSRVSNRTALTVAVLRHQIIVVDPRRCAVLF